ncbi:MAG TPA: UDP-3-O-acyl-N-acetylglucosamine deacetylase, partial [Vicinamibacterales bacterium]|nr:UDP-3-O-acyl-N-acetylglucosamine deacetylase [Vicinamibacterales bacterium]
VVGDLALVGHPIVGHLVVHRGGHALHTALASEILRQRDAWQFVESPEAVAAHAGMSVPASRPATAG